MEQEIIEALLEYWEDPKNTKAQLEEFGLSLNPPLNLDTGKSKKHMLGDLVHHCADNGVELRFNASFDTSADAFMQITNVVGTDTPPGPPSEQLTHPRPEDPQEEPVRDLQPQEPEKPKPSKGKKAVVGLLDRLEERLSLPPAHQNHISGEERALHEECLALVGHIRTAVAG